MSFIAKNPMTIPEIETTPPIPLTGTRGLFAKSDGWYDIDNEGNMNGLQHKTDDALKTTDKTVVGAINEIDTNKELEIERIKYYGDPDIIPSDESYFVVNETGETITGLTEAGKTQTELVIPYKINDVEITTLNSGNSITSILEGNSVITKVVIPNIVTSIGDFAFYGCTSLTSIIISNSITSIGVSAFRECTSLTSINIPNIVTTIGDRAFYNCTSLTSVEIPNSVTSIRSGAFYGCTSLTSIIIPNSITSIGVSVFKNCSSLTSINIPSSVTNIGNDVFTGCTNLTIYCEQGSYAETFANNKGFNIVYTDISKTVLNNKVDKETGKGLSANDFTDYYKTKLEGIAENAEVNVQSDWNETDTAKDAYIHNKPSIYTRVESDNRYLPQDTAAGTVPQTEYALAANAINYQVYGNSVQDGTPTPDAPIAVQSVGDLVTSGEHAGKYAITETITNGDTTETITVYLDEPLRKLGNYADYIDYEQQKVIRNIVKIHIAGPFAKYNDIIWQFYTGKFILKTSKELCSHFKNASSGSDFGINNKNATGYYVCVSQVKANMGLTLAEFNTWLTENEVYYYAVLVTPTEESITLAPMPLGAGTNSITTGTAIQPSNVIVDYYQNPTDVINSLKAAIVAMQSQTE